jgi:hypothetical protein
MAKLPTPPPMPPMPPLPLQLDERIRQVRIDIEAYVNAKVAEVKRDCVGLPEGTIRNTIVRGNCLCASFLELKAADDKAAAI